jgi:hypothetical protein
MREVDALDRLSGLGDDVAKRQFHRLQVRVDRGENILRQHIEDAIGVLRHRAAPAVRRERDRVSQPLTPIVVVSDRRTIGLCMPDSEHNRAPGGSESRLADIVACRDAAVVTFGWTEPERRREVVPA